jgi:hypothetical protein
MRRAPTLADIPMQLYKFTSISARAIAAIASGKFYAATLEKMNDPFEDRFKAASGSLRVLANACGVFCVSRSTGGANDVLTNPLMWAHYTSNHSGVAIGLQTVDEKSGYSEVIYLAHDRLEQELASLENQYKSRAHTNAQSLVRLAFKFKPEFWAYEHEYRRIVVGPNRYIDPGATINEIVFGFRTRPEDELAVWCALRDRVRYRKATSVQGFLSIIPYEPPTNVTVGPESLLDPDHLDVDIHNLEPASLPLVPNVEFKRDT